MLTGLEQTGELPPNMAAAFLKARNPRLKNREPQR
jgi:hypothetical protein